MVTVERPARTRMPFRPALEQLRSAQKTPRGVSTYSLRINRPAGRILAAAGSALGLTPNVVTLLSGLCSVGAAVLLALGHRGLVEGVVVAFLLMLGFALDSADGQLARLRNGGSRSGEWLDHMVDAVTKVALHLAVAIGWYRDDLRGARLLLPLAFTVAATALFVGGTLVGLMREADAAKGTAHARASSGVPAPFLLPVDHGVVSLAFVVWAFPDVFAFVYGFLLLAHLLYFTAYARRWFAELS